MKPKLILIVLALVILPTSILSFLANRALRSREELLQYRLKMDAASAIQIVSKRIQARFEDDMEHVRSVVSECLARGGKNADIEAAAFRLRNSRGTVNQIYLFMNPWGFIYPEPGKQDEVMKQPLEKAQPASAIQRRVSGTERQLDPLVSALRREIVSSGTGTNAISLTVEDSSYWFSALPNKKSMYAGFEINQAEFLEELSSALTAASGETFMLIAEGPGITRAKEVIVSDVFGEKGEIRSQGPDLSEEPVASRRLLKPFDYVNIKAFIVDSGRIKKAAELQYRLYAWGIVLMAAGVCIGLLLVLREAAAEIRRARARSDFVIGVSHDLRTPVASMRMLAESLYLDHVESHDQQKKFLRVIVRESERLGQLIERVLFFVRMDQKSLIYRFTEVDIGKLVAVTVEAFKARAEIRDQKAEIRAYHLSIGTAIEPGLPHVKADESAITQVILNLLDNAAKYLKKDTEDKNQAVSSQSVPSFIEPKKTLVNNQQSAVQGIIVEKSASGIPLSHPSSGVPIPVTSKVVSRVPLPESIKQGVTVSRPEISNSPDATTINPKAVSSVGGDVVRYPIAEQRGGITQPSISIEVSSVADSFRHHRFMPRRRWVKISFKDRGIGIEKKELRRIFKRFYRVRATADSNVSGVGLGLALCRHVTEAHGGWIEVDSELGKGSTFSVYLLVSGKGTII
ncbi:MAG: ATP-binding protein [Kiritimatiellae bacterium]|nr:ATP-binding protein [Kiritimatiellia bacterium]MDD5521916.1 ATP-binding protein [Kiritimatiellia bacterium]